MILFLCFYFRTAQWETQNPEYVVETTAALGISFLDAYLCYLLVSYKKTTMAISDASKSAEANLNRVVNSIMFMLDVQCNDPNNDCLGILGGF